MARQWRMPDHPGQELVPRVFHIPANSTTFGDYYNEVQELLKAMAGMDELLPGTFFGPSSRNVFNVGI